MIQLKRLQVITLWTQRLSEPRSLNADELPLNDNITVLDMSELNQ
jgi:hypothetical protein